MLLYRWSRSEEFVEAVACGELYDYLVKGNTIRGCVSKRRFGRTILKALDYDCRRLKGITLDNDKVKKMYHVRYKEELQYGLEYMICAWLRKFLEQQSAPGETTISGPEEMEIELDILINSDYSEFISLYVNPMMTMDAHRIQEPDWRALLRKSDLIHN